MAARPHWYFSSIGLMNSVQPYCRLAIITMQMTPRASWPHRVHTEATAGTLADVVVMLTPGRVWRCQYSLHRCSESLASMGRGSGLKLRRRTTVTAAAPCRWSDDRATMARSSSARLSHVGSRTRSVAAIRRFRQAARADRLYPLLRLLLHGNNGPHRGHHCARPACLRRCAAEHALPVSNSHVLDRALVSCNRNSPGQCDRRDRRVVLVVHLVAGAQRQRRAGAQ